MTADDRHTERVDDNCFTSNLNDSRNDHRLRADLFLHKTLQMDAQVFFEQLAVGDVFGFHVGDGFGDRLASVGGETI